MSTATRKPPATLADLYRIDGKAELIDGRIVPLMPTGFRPNAIAGAIYVSLRTYAQASGRGVACTDNIGFTVPKLLSGRESFSPDASSYDGPLPDDEMNFIAGAPTFAVEVRSKSDHSSAAEAEMAAKRLDYFEAGTLVVWDVDPRAGCVHTYRASAPDQPVTYRKGGIADAEPALPGWRMAVDEIFV